MENIDQQDTDLENSEKEVLDGEEETKEETPDWETKAKEAEAEAAKWRRIAERSAKKAEKPEKSSEEESKPKASGELDLGAIAYLNSLVGLKGKDEIALAREYIANGKTVLDLADNKFFKQDLEALREARATAEATPKGNKRSVQPAPNDFDTALAKYRETGELPQDRTLREKVVDAQIDFARNKNVFSDNPIVSS